MKAALTLPVQERQTDQGTSHLRQSLAACLACWLLCAGFVSANFSWHHWLHEDAHEESHQCFISLIENQQISGGDAPAAVVTLAGEWSHLPMASQTRFISTVDWLSTPSRAPPAVS